MDHKKKTETIRHSFAHVLAQAILRLYPTAKLGIGPATKDGFYYDFEIESLLTKKDLIVIENEMKDIILEEMPFTQINVSKDNAYNTLLQLGQIYKTELLKSIPDDNLSFYKTGEEFLDLCRGPHVKHTGLLNNFKLIKISNHHWLNDQTRPIFMRIEGVAFATKKEFNQYLQNQQKLKISNHNQIGQKQKLFAYTNNKRLIWLSKGIALKNIFFDKIKQQLEVEGSTFIDASQMIRLSQFSEKYQIKQVPFLNHEQYFKMQKRGSSHLPLQVSQFENIFKPKFPSKKPNLLKAEEYTTLVSTIYSNKKHLNQQVVIAINQVYSFLNTIKFDDYHIKILMSDHSDKNTLEILSEILEDTNINVTVINQEMSTDIPQMVFVVKDEYGRNWDISSISIDLNTNNKNQLKYHSTTTKLLKPFIVRITFLKSFNLFLAISLENNGGAFPLWLAPIQVELISISQKYNDAVRNVSNLLKEHNIRTNINTQNQTVQFKIRQAELNQIPFMLIIGDKEIKTNSVAVRTRENGDIGLVKLDKFIEEFKKDLLNSNNTQ